MKEEFRTPFVKYTANPVFGNIETGTCFDALVTRVKNLYRMDFSWRPKKSLGVTFSSDGITWSVPQITLESDPDSGWEDNINRSSVVYRDGRYHVWYTGQSHDKSFIGYAESEDGLHFERMSRSPVLLPEHTWEGMSVMNPCVLYDEKRGIWRMWYAAGETIEPNLLAYAESEDCIRWHKSEINPILTAEPHNVWEKDRIGGCQVLETEDMGYLMFYIGYEDINTARICAARSPDGITRWVRSPYNPLISPDKNLWDSDACYKPTVLWNDEKKQWMLWYNGRRGEDEYIGLATCGMRNLF